MCTHCAVHESICCLWILRLYVSWFHANDSYACCRLLTAGILGITIATVVAAYLLGVYCVLLGTVNWMPTTAFFLLLFFLCCFCVDTRANVICSCTRLAYMQYDDENRYESNNANEWANKNIVRKFQRFECVCVRRRRRRRRHQHHNNNMIRRSILRHIGYLSVATMQTNHSNDTLCRRVQSVHTRHVYRKQVNGWMNEK